MNWNSQVNGRKLQLCNFRSQLWEMHWLPFAMELYSSYHTTTLPAISIVDREVNGRNRKVPICRDISQGMILKNLHRSNLL